MYLIGLATVEAVCFCAYGLGGDLVGAAKTNSTARNQLIDGATDTNNTKYLDDALHGSKKNPVTVEYKTHGDADEFARQLKEQQDGLNNMTAGEIKENIEKYRSNGRSSDSSKQVTSMTSTPNIHRLLWSSVLTAILPMFMNTETAEIVPQ